MKMVKDVTIVSLSRGILGEPFIKHELDIGVKRLQEYGMNVHFSKHALSGLAFTAEHPELRAADLLEALSSSTDMILCAVGGDDTYRLLPYLFENDELKGAVSDKIFLGFSDTTVNHFMLAKAGMNTFYGQAFLPDVCEIAEIMLPYTRSFFEELISTGRISAVTPAPEWYDSREDFSEAAVGTFMPSHPNEGFKLLQGPAQFSGKILGGCIDTIFDMFNNERYEDSVRLCQKYNLFPDPDFWKGRILLLESSEEKASPEKYRKMVQALKATGIFNEISGVLVGKPADERYFSDYCSILVEEINNPSLPILANINVGHAAPRCIIPFGVTAHVDADSQRILFDAD